MKTTVTPEIKISVVDLHTSCPVATRIRVLEEQLAVATNQRDNYEALAIKYEKGCRDCAVELEGHPRRFNKLQEEYNILNKMNVDYITSNKNLVSDNAELKRSLISQIGSYNALSANYDALSAKHAELEAHLIDLKKVCEVYQKDAIIHHERRVRAIDLLKVVRDAAESQVDVINDFL